MWHDRSSLMISCSGVAIALLAVGPFMVGAIDVEGADLFSRVWQESRQRRQLQADIGDKTIDDLNQLPCNSILANVPVDILVEQLQEGLGAVAGAFTSQLKYDVQVRKICASCINVMRYRSSENAEIFDSFCGNDVYGSNATFSSLIALPLAPLEADVQEETAPASEPNRSLLPGVLKTAIWMHPTEVAVVPTIAWELSNGTDSLNSLFVGLASRGFAMLLPDLMGYGESTPQGIIKAYLIRKAYETSTLPIWWMARDIIGNETNCETTLGNGVAISGYSEGGYSSIAVADVMVRLGVNVVDVRSGAGPLKYESAAMFGVLKGYIDGTFPSRRRHIAAIFVVPVSSTYTGLPNYNQGQDLVHPERRDEILALVQNSLTTEDLSESIPTENYLDYLFNPDVLAFGRTAIANNNLDPCETSTLEELKEKNVDLLCETGQQQNLIRAVETAKYPLQICHSPDDEVVVFENVPDFDTLNNPNVTFLLSSGDHNEASLTCLFPLFLYLVSDDFHSIEISADAMCTAVLEQPAMPTTEAPSATPEMAPQATPTDTSDSGVTSVGYTVSFLLSVLFCVAM